MTLRHFSVRFLFCCQKHFKSVILPASPLRQFCRSAPLHKQRTSGKQDRNNSPGFRFPPSSPADSRSDIGGKTGRMHISRASEYFFAGIPAFSLKPSTLSHHPPTYPASTHPVHRNRRDTGFRLPRPPDTRRIPRLKRRIPGGFPWRYEPSRRTAGH